MASTRELLEAGIARLREAATDPALGLETPRLDAELLLAHAIGVDRTAVVAHPDAPVGPSAEAAFREAIDRRSRGEPVAYLRGIKEFHGIALAVDPRALIPRPETERVVDLALDEIMRRLTSGARPPTAGPLQVIDIGTGSGAIAVALAVALRARRVPAEDVRITAFDVAPDALDLARENAVGHAVGDRLQFEGGDLLPPVGTGPWEVIAANLPYVRSDAMASLPRAAAFEPPVALDGGVDGLALIGRLLDLLPTVLDAEGAAMLEIGGDQEGDLRGLVAERLPAWACTVELDLGGLPRVAVLRPPRGAAGATG